MATFGKNFKVIPLKHQPAHLNFIHNQLPLEDQLNKRSSTVKDANLKLCPKCWCQAPGPTDENRNQFLQCPKNPNGKQSINNMLNTLRKGKHHPSRPVASCIEERILPAAWTSRELIHAVHQRLISSSHERNSANGN